MTIEEYEELMQARGYTKLHLYGLTINYWVTDEEGYQTLDCYKATGFEDYRSLWNHITAFTQTHNVRASAVEDYFVWWPEDEPVTIKESR